MEGPCRCLGFEVCYGPEPQSPRTGWRAGWRAGLRAVITATVTDCFADHPYPGKWLTGRRWPVTTCILDLERNAHSLPLLFFLSFRSSSLGLLIVQVVAHFMCDLHLDWLSPWQSSSKACLCLIECWLLRKLDVLKVKYRLRILEFLILESAIMDCNSGWPMLSLCTGIWRNCTSAPNWGKRLPRCNPTKVVNCV